MSWRIKIVNTNLLPANIEYCEHSHASIDEATECLIAKQELTDKYLTNSGSTQELDNFNFIIEEIPLF